MPVGFTHPTERRDWPILGGRAEPQGTTNVIANFKQVAKDGDLRLRPIVTTLANADTP